MHKRMANKSLMTTAAGLSVFWIDASALAQSREPADEIVVTARRVEEKLENVPVAVTALSPANLQERRILSELDLQTAVPGFTVRTTQSSQLDFAMRGQTVDAFSYSSPAITTYINEFQFGGVRAMSFFDFESLQVLKGPQGTLFGRNSTGGAVLYQTRRPGDDLGGYLRVGYGNYDNVEVEGAFDVPVNDFAALRIAGRYHDRDGFQKNLYDGVDLNSVKTRDIRATLRLGNGGPVENTTTAQYSRSLGRGAGMKLRSVYAPGQTNNGYVLNSTAASIYGPGFISLDPRLTELGFTNGILDYFNRQQDIGFYDVYNNVSSEHDAKQFLVTNAFSWEISPGLNLKSITGYNDVDTNDVTDNEGSPFYNVLVGHNPNDVDGFYFYDKNFSQELHLSGELFDGDLNYIIGAYYFWQETILDLPLLVFSDAFPGGAPPGNFRYHFKNTSNSKALFAQATYEIVPRLNFTGGFRYTWDDVKLTHYDDDLFDILGVPGGEVDTSKPSWTVGLDFQANDALLLYVANRGSFRTAGFNGTSSANGLTNQFEPETSYDIEVGAKLSSEIGGAPFTLNVAAYNQIAKDVQRSVSIGVASVTGNVNKARVRGVEVDFSLRPADWLEFGGQGAFTDFDYTDPIATFANQTLSFGPAGNTPRYSGGAYVRLSHDLQNSMGELAFIVNGYAQSMQYFSNLAATTFPDTDFPGYQLLDLRAEWKEIAGTRASMAAYAKNVTGEKYYTGGQALGNVIGLNGYNPGFPRFYGVEFGIEF